MMRTKVGALVLALAFGASLAAQTRAEPTTPEVAKVKLMKIETSGIGG
jgi:hypothetical protein